MMNDLLKIIYRSPQSVLEDVLGVSAVFTIVVVGLHFPVSF